MTKLRLKALYLFDIKPLITERDYRNLLVLRQTLFVESGHKHNSQPLLAEGWL